MRPSETLAPRSWGVAWARAGRLIITRSKEQQARDARHKRPERNTGWRALGLATHQVLDGRVLAFVALAEWVGECLRNRVPATARDPQHASTVITRQHHVSTTASTRVQGSGWRCWTQWRGAVPASRAHAAERSTHTHTHTHTHTRARVGREQQEELKLVGLGCAGVTQRGDVRRACCRQGTSRTCRRG